MYPMFTSRSRCTIDWRRWRNFHYAIMDRGRLAAALKAKPGTRLLGVRRNRRRITLRCSA